MENDEAFHPGAKHLSQQIRQSYLRWRAARNTGDDADLYRICTATHSLIALFRVNSGLARQFLRQEDEAINAIFHTLLKTEVPEAVEAGLSFATALRQETDDSSLSAEALDGRINFYKNVKASRPGIGGGPDSDAKPKPR